MSTFTYTIAAFDEATRIVRIDIAGEGLRDIPLIEPLPNSVEELELQIRPWAAHEEIVEARQKPHDFSFLATYIGTSRETDRFRRTPIIPPQSPPETPPPEAMMAEETAFVEDIVDRIMRDRGLIQ